MEESTAFILALVGLFTGITAGFFGIGGGRLSSLVRFLPILAIAMQWVFRSCKCFFFSGRLYHQLQKGLIGFERRLICRIWRANGGDFRELYSKNH